MGTGLDVDLAMLAEGHVLAGRGRRDPGPEAAADMPTGCADLGRGSPLIGLACLDGELGLAASDAEASRCREALDATEGPCIEGTALATGCESAARGAEEEEDGVTAADAARAKAAAGRVAPWLPILLVPLLTVRAALDATLATLIAAGAGASPCLVEICRGTAVECTCTRRAGIRSCLTANSVFLAELLE